MEETTRDQGPRAYKSRRDRPCDLCRLRKFAFRIDSSPPCIFCQSRGSDCTLLEKPPTKRRRTISSSPAGNRITSPSEPPGTSAWNWVDAISPAFDSTFFNNLVFFEDGSPQSVGQHGSSNAARNDQTQSKTVENGSGPQEPEMSPEKSSFWDVRTLHGSHFPPDTASESIYRQWPDGTRRTTRFASSSLAEHPFGRCRKSEAGRKHAGLVTCRSSSSLSHAEV